MELDHLAIAGETLDEARYYVEEALGVPLQKGGKHNLFGTHNFLLGLEDGLYLEAIAIDPDAQAPNRPRWFDLDRFDGSPRLTNWICRTDDLDAVIAELPSGYGQPTDLQRGDLKWRMAVPKTGVLPYDNCAPAIMQWQTHIHPAQLLKPSGVGLKRLTIRHPAAETLQKELHQRFFDKRVVFERGDPGLSAVFDTAHGEREISS